jgi:hypothetical protein
MTNDHRPDEQRSQTHDHELETTMITRSHALDGSVTEFHIAHAGLPCTIWHRGGPTHVLHADSPMPAWLNVNTGGYFVPVFRNENPANLHRDPQTQWHHITGVNAGDFHIAAECPQVLRTGDDRPPVSHMLTADAELPTGRNEWGFAADGYDANGYDADGYDADGYDADGYDSSGYDADGDPRPGSLDAGDLDLDELWSDFHGGGSARWNAYSRQSGFRQHLRELVSDPDEIDSLAFCDNCGDPGWDEDMPSTQGGDVHLCGSCWDDWMTCDSCDDRYPSEDITETLSGSDVCDSCRGNYYSFCEDCDGWYHDDSSYDHEHSSGDGCCESPQTAFAIRNDGDEPLANDTRITITLPVGTISGEGMTAIARYLRDQGHYDVSYDLDQIGDQWQTRAGNFTKRLSRHAHVAHQSKLTPETLSQVGCIARDHSTAVSVAIEVSRELNQDAGYWYHEDSCYWGSYSESRCALKTNGAFGLRSLDSDGDATGRAWVMPLRRDESGHMRPTFDTMTPDAFVVFNGYGDLSGYAAPRIVAHMAGWTYRKIDFNVDPMYINAAGGYLVAPEDIAAPYTDGSLYLSVRQHSSLFETERVLVNA